MIQYFLMWDIYVRTIHDELIITYFIDRANLIEWIQEWYEIQEIAYKDLNEGMSKYGKEFSCMYINEK